jgi:nitroreductase/NAD-dependent dihydropyrimidine dehydrogenase PreA subunit
MPLIAIDPELCRRDGLCARICPKVFSWVTEGSVPVVAHEDSCNACGHCVLVCPSGAIRQAGCPPEKVFPAGSQLMPSYEQLRDLIRTRRSIRTFQKRGVDREVMEKVIDGARFAPSAKNSQSTQFTVVQDKAVLTAISSTTAEWLGKVAVRLRNPLWRKLYYLAGERDTEEVKQWVGQFDLIAERAREGSDMILFHAPALLLFHAHARIRLADVNANLALQNSTLIACSLGLGAFYAGYVVTACSHNKAVLRLIDLPKGHKVYGGLAIGYPEVKFSRWIERNPASIKWV